MTKLSEKKGGGLIYNPPRMLFDGSTGYYRNLSFTSSGDMVTGIVWGVWANQSGSLNQAPLRVNGPAGHQRLHFLVGDNDRANADERNVARVLVKNSSGTTICDLVGVTPVNDGRPHCLAFRFNGATAAYEFLVDGKPEDNLSWSGRVAPTTGTLDSGALSDILVGATNSAPSQLVDGSIGFVGYDDTYSISLTDLVDQYGNPKQTDFSGWLFGHFAGKMDENEGTAGAMTKNGTITLVDPGPCPHIGLPTIGTAVAADIASGKIAWVNGVEIVGTAV